jgi:hypothetical protein
VSGRVTASCHVFEGDEETWNLDYLGLVKKSLSYKGVALERK